MTSQVDNVGRCPRCNQFIIAEDVNMHVCDIQITDIKTVIVDSCYTVGTDKNLDEVTSALALDGTLYRLILCKHNPPHGATKRKFTGYGTQQGLDRAS